MKNCGKEVIKARNKRTGTMLISDLEMIELVPIFIYRTESEEDEELCSARSVKLQSMQP